MSTFKVTGEEKDGIPVIIALGWATADEVGSNYCQATGDPKVYVKVADPRSKSLESTYVLYVYSNSNALDAPVAERHFNF